MNLLYLSVESLGLNYISVLWLLYWIGQVKRNVKQCRKTAVQDIPMGETYV